jgi:hypothetical protein
MPSHAVPIRRRTEHVSPITYVVVTFAFTWTCWWLAALDARGLIALPVPCPRSSTPLIRHGTMNASGELLKAVPEYAVRPAPSPRRPPSPRASTCCSPSS